MKNKAKKLVAALLTVLMLLSIVPMGMLEGTDLAEAFGTAADAAGLNKYCATAAAEWAKAHWNDYTSLLFGKGYFEIRQPENWGGDCANFVSQCLYMGGIDMDKYWNISGWDCHFGPNTDVLGTKAYYGSFIRCDQLYNYLKKIGAKEIRNPSASDVSVGDVLLYCKNHWGDKTHSAICIDKVNGVPILAAHSADGPDAMYTTYDGRDWHLGHAGNLTVVMKLNGSTCVNKNPRSFGVYTANRRPKLYNSTNTYNGYSWTYHSGEYTHVYETRTVNGVRWGYTFRYGSWGWIRLNEFTYQRHIDSPSVDHDWGGWKTVQVANCRQDGIDRRTCRRCGVTQDKTTKGGHIINPKASCLAPGVCKICGEEIDPALGHDYTGEWTVTLEPTCTEKGERKLYCPRVSNGKLCGALLKTEEIAELGHDYVAGATDPSCTANGTKTYHCSRGDSDYVDYIDADNTWSDWTEEVHSAIPASKVQTKTQYRYRNKQKQESYATSIDGWTRTGNSYWKETDNGSFEYVEKFPSGFGKGHSLYQKYNKAHVAAYETETDKKTVSTYDVGRYIYWHWCELETYSSGPVGRRIADRYYSETLNGQLRNYHTFHAFELSSKLTIDGEIITYKDANLCKCTYWWFGWAENDSGTTGYIPIKNYTYTDYKHVFEYYKWDEWSAWQEEPLTATDDMQVETRTLYRYDLAALGHDFSVATDKAFVIENKQLETNTDGSLKEPLCRTSGFTCSRCGAVSPDSIKENHVIPDWNTERDAYRLVSENNSVKIYRADCKNGCGCYILRSENVCDFKVDKVVEPTCTKDGYTVYKCISHGETYTADTVKALGHDLTNGKSEIIKAPDCVNAGIKRTYCVRYDNGKTCDCCKDESIAPLGHKLTKHDAVSVTCLTDGSKEYYECSACGKFYADKDAKTEMKKDAWVIKAPGKHLEPDEWEIVTEAACGTTGWKQKHCTRVNDGKVCGELIKEEEIPEIKPVYIVESADNAKYKNGEYDGSEYVPDTWEPTSCEKFGILYITCKNCQGTDHEHGYTVYIGTASHVKSDWKTDVEPSCIQVGHKHTECVNCGTELDEADIAALGHIKGERVTVYPTCTAGGYTYWVCKRDGCSETREDGTVGAHIEKLDVTAATGHSTSPKDANYASSSDKMELVSSVKNVCGDGTVDTYRCKHVDKNNKNTRCDYTVVIGSAKGHNISADFKVIKQPTCTEDGIKVKPCTNSGCTYSEQETVIPALGHDYKHDSSRDVAAKCTEPGVKGYTCSRCGARNDQIIPELGHDLKLDKSIAATCTEPARNIEKCQRNGCSHTETKIIGDALGHDFSGIYAVTTKATCTENGVKTLTCVRVNGGATCGKTLGTQTILARGHEWSEWSVSKAPTCTAKGTEKRTCTHTETAEYAACTAFETRDAALLGHVYGKWVDNGDGKTHTKTCTRTSCTASTADHTVTANHNTSKTAHKDAICTVDGYDEYICADCGYKYRKTIAKLGHDWGAWTVTTAATCTKDGIEKRVCKRDASHVGTRTVKAKGHVEVIDAEKAATCTEKGLTEGKHCSTCKEILVAQKEVAALGHDWGEWTVTTAATCTKDGSEKRVCKRDASHVETRTIKATGHIEVVDAAVDPTCTEKGLTEGKHCSTCKEILVAQKEVAALGHEMGVWKVVKEADYGVDGLERRECARFDKCGYYETRSIPALIKNIYNATFIIGENVIAVVPFEEGATSIDEPDIPKKDNYVGKWDSYEIKNGDFTVYGRYEKINADEVSEIIPGKTAEEKDGRVKITLSGSAETVNVKTYRTESEPLDVVFVLDRSGSMAYDFSEKDRTAKVDKLKESVKSFTDTLYKNAQQTGADHRVALVGFASGPEYGYQNTGIIRTNSGTSKQYRELANYDYSDVFMPVADELGGLNANITAGINDIRAEGATAADLGFSIAYELFANNPANGHKRIVIFITDGVPTYNNASIPWEVCEVADKAVNAAYALKNEQHASIYTVAIYSEANETQGFGDGFGSFDINRFMHAVSSNYPNAIAYKPAYDAAGDAKDVLKERADDSYYRTGNSAAEFAKTLNTIMVSTVYNVVSYTKATIRDTLSENVTLTLEDEAAMRAKLKAELGLSDADITVARQSDGTTLVEFRNVKVKKLLDSEGKEYFNASVSFDATLNKNALEKGTYKTNTDDAGIYVDGNQGAEFDSPEVTLEADRCIVAFTVNGIAFRIEEKASGDRITAPDTDVAKWDIPADAVVTSAYTEFEAIPGSVKSCTVTWVYGDKTETQTYGVGDEVIAPDIEAPEGKQVKWTPSVSRYMGTHDVTYTAVFVNSHEHRFTKLVSAEGDCTAGITRVLKCFCGETKTVEVPPASHTPTVVIANDEVGTVSVICSVCGAASDNKFRISTAGYGHGGYNKYYDFKLTYGETTVQPNGKFLIKLRLSGDDARKSFAVYRVEDNNMTRISAKKSNGWLIIEADHFSIYAVCELDDGGKLVSSPSYADALCALNGHKYTDTVIPATCTEDGCTQHTCSVCGSSYKDNVVKAVGHVDEDKDGKCDNCGTSTIGNCKHICHSSNKLAQFFWKIIRFFCKLFRTNEFCACGVKHW